MTDQDSSENDLGILALFVNMADFDGISVGVTLTVGGLLVTGQLSSRNEYQRGLAEALGTVQGNDQGKAAAKQLSAAFTDASKRAPTADDAGAPPPARVLHLRDVQFHGPALTRVSWWACKVSAVDGFALGIPSSS